MKYLEGEEKIIAGQYLNACIEKAQKSTCQRSKCGSIIVLNGEIIGSGFNSPSGESEAQRRCKGDKNSYHKKVTDKTCCMHAEQRAMMDALRKNSEKIIGARLYFIRLDEDGNAAYSGEPYCTICSKMAFDTGIEEFVLNKKEGICVYNTDEYNIISYQYDDQKK